MVFTSFNITNKTCGPLIATAFESDQRARIGRGEVLRKGYSNIETAPR